MTIQSHVETLKSKHSDIEKVMKGMNILLSQHPEFLRPQPDSVRLSELKKEKLLLKEEMRRYSA